MIIPAIHRTKIRDIYQKLKGKSGVFVKSNYVIRHVTSPPDIQIGNHGDFGIDVSTGKMYLKQYFKWVSVDSYLKEKEILIPHTIYAASNYRPNLDRRNDADPTRDKFEDFIWSSRRKADIYTISTDKREVESTTGSGSILSNQSVRFPVRSPFEVIFSELVSDSSVFGIGIARTEYITYEKDGTTYEFGANVEHGEETPPIEEFYLYTNDGKFHGNDSSTDVIETFDTNAKPGIEFFADRIYFTKEEVTSSNIKYGRLYSHNVVTGGEFFENYTLPTESDWNQLVDYIDTTYTQVDGVEVGNHLKSRRQVDSPLGAPWDTEEHPRWNSHISEYGRDTVKFSAIPAGTSSAYLGENGYFLTSSITEGGNAVAKLISYSSETVNSVGISVEGGASVRYFREATLEEQDLNDGTVVEIIKDYDHNPYECVKIGQQVWLKQNLASTHYLNGTLISTGSPVGENMIFTDEIVGTKRVRIGETVTETTVGALIPPEEEGGEYSWEEIDKEVVQPAFKELRDLYSIVLFKGSDDGTVSATLRGKIFIPSIWRNSTVGLAKVGTSIWQSTGIKNQYGKLKKPWSVPFPMTYVPSSESNPTSSDFKLNYVESLKAFVV